MKLVKSILSSFLMCAVFAYNSMAEAQEYDRLVQVIVDDTGALQDELDPQSSSNARKALQKYLSGLSSQYGRGTQVIVASQYGARNVWSGDARMIQRSSQNIGLQRFLQEQWGGCSDLIRLFRLLEDNIYLYSAEEYEVVFFSSLIHTGDPCEGTNFSAEVKLPDEFLGKLKDFHARYEAKLGFYWVFDNGRSKIREQLVTFSRNNDIDYILKVESETRSERFR